MNKRAWILLILLVSTFFLLSIVSVSALVTFYSPIGGDIGLSPGNTYISPTSSSLDRFCYEKIGPGSSWESRSLGDEEGTCDNWLWDVVNQEWIKKGL